MQQEFDAVVEHLYKQGRPSKKLAGCFYRNDKGLSCAVGCRIPDNVYDPKMDAPDYGDSTLHELILNFEETLPVEIVAYKEMFAELQELHDTCKLNEDGTFHDKSLYEELLYVSESFNLTLNIPQKGE
jgi:hypothetical protein